MEAALLSSLATGAQIALPLLSGAGENQQARAEAEQNRINAEIARTRADQTSANARYGLEAELSNMRAALGANSQAPNVGTFEIFQELRANRDLERSIAVGNELSTAGQYAAAGRAAESRGRASLFNGFGRAAPSIFDFYQLYNQGD